MIHGNPAAATPLSNAAMTVIAKLLEERTGQQIAANRAWRLDAALKPILRDLSIASIDDLIGRLIAARDPQLSDQVVDALLNQETSFFRDLNVIEAVCDAVAEMRAANTGRRVRIWSTGCSSGQEPLSLAMVLIERGLGPEAVDILATDVSFGAVARARTGRFSQFEIQRGLSIHRMIAWFDGEGDEWTAKRALLDRVQFRQHNLVADRPPPGQFDVILCRNVLLYFAPDMRRAVFDHLASASKRDALLVLGAGETVIGQTEAFRPSERWRGLYRRA